MKARAKKVGSRRTGTQKRAGLPTKKASLRVKQGRAGSRTAAKEVSAAPGAGEVILYRPPGGRIQLDVRLERDTVWLSLNQMARLFGRDKSVVSRHLQNVFKSRELQRPAVVAENATTAADGKTYQVEYFRRVSTWR